MDRLLGTDASQITHKYRLSLFLPALILPPVSLQPQQGRKGSFCSPTWFPTSSRIIVTNNPWLRLVLTMTTTALILVMAVFNMVRSRLRVQMFWMLNIAPLHDVELFQFSKPAFLVSFVSSSWRIPEAPLRTSWLLLPR